MTTTSSSFFSLSNILLCSLVFSSCQSNQSPRTLVNVNLPSLEYLSQHKSEILLWHLQASPEWKVQEEFSALACYRRVKEKGQWKMPFNGYVSEHNPEFIQTRYMFRFGPEGGGPFRNKFNRHFFIAVHPLAGDTYLKVKKSDQGVESCLAVGRPGVWFEFFDQTPHEERRLTREALQWAEDFLSQIRQHEMDIQKNGFASLLLPVDSVKKGPTSLDIEMVPLEPSVAVSLAGIYMVQAWVNGGQPGRVFVKVFNEDTGKELEPSRFHRQTHEYVGWSPDANVKFPFEVQIDIREGASYGKYNLRIEIWHQPSTGKEERKLIGKTILTQGWYQ